MVQTPQSNLRVQASNPAIKGSKELKNLAKAQVSIKPEEGILGSFK
jgi:hypothetical protein